MAFNSNKVSQDVDAILRRIGKYKYERETKTLVMDVLSQTAGQLSAFADTYYHNDGTSSEQLKIFGTMSTVYKRQTFNTPIEIWLPYDFPRIGPLLFVVQCDDMKIPKKHKHVGSDGRVYHSYLSDWNSESTLSVLLMFVSSTCGKMPPLVRVAPGQPTPELADVIRYYKSQHAQAQTQPQRIRVTAKPIAAAPAPSRLQPSNTSNYPYNHHYTPAPAPVRAPVPASQNFQDAPPAYQHYPAHLDAQSVIKAQSQEAIRQEEAAREAARRAEEEQKALQAAEEEKLHRGRQQRQKEIHEREKAEARAAHARSQVTLRLQNEMKQIILHEEAKIAKLEDLQRKMTMKANSMDNKLQDLLAYRGSCQQTVENLNRELNDTVQWIAATEEKLAEGSLVSPADPKSAQLIHLVARAAAMEDLMFELERMLADERIKIGRFLKLVRKYARAEFMDLALAHKVVGKLAAEQSSN